jgi:type I restriction enzyme, S subunit
MANKWQSTTLGSVCTVITDGSHSSPKTVSSGMPMASVKDLNFWGLNLKTARLISLEDYEELVRQGCKPQMGDVLIAKDGNSALDTVCVVEEPIDTVLLSSIAILRCNQTLITPRFLKYYFMSPQTIRYLKNNFISGAAIPRIVLRDFKRAQIDLPPLPEQRAIAHILGSLDDKIELNRKRNETLEAIVSFPESCRL